MLIWFWNLAYASCFPHVVFGVLDVFWALQGSEKSSWAFYCNLWKHLLFCKTAELVGSSFRCNIQSLCSQLYQWETTISRKFLEQLSLCWGLDLALNNQSSTACNPQCSWTCFNHALTFWHLTCFDIQALDIISFLETYHFYLLKLKNMNLVIAFLASLF